MKLAGDGTAVAVGHPDEMLLMGVQMAFGLRVLLDARPPLRSTGQTVEERRIGLVHPVEHDSGTGPGRVGHSLRVERFAVVEHRAVGEERRPVPSRLRAEDRHHAGGPESAGGREALRARSPRR